MIMKIQQAMKKYIEYHWCIHILKIKYMIKYLHLLKLNYIINKNKIIII